MIGTAQDPNADSAPTDLSLGTSPPPEANQVAADTADLLERLRRNNRTLLVRRERIVELESVANCIVHLSSKVQKPELENETRD